MMSDEEESLLAGDSEDLRESSDATVYRLTIDASTPASASWPQMNGDQQKKKCPKQVWQRMTRVVAEVIFSNWEDSIYAVQKT